MASYHGRIRQPPGICTLPGKLIAACKNPFSPVPNIFFSGSKNRISQRHMLLSIIIVNYNVKHFLEQCLCSVKVAMQQIDAEVIVVDNNSTDDSVAYLQSRYSWVKFIENRVNKGFARANNQALPFAAGKYILFLNPDTLLREDCLQQCLQFFENNKDAGALGVRMIDGSGCFLRESKRAFPSPLTSLFKLSGLSSLFPKSKIFSRYHLGHLPENGNHQVDVLAGAFMMTRQQVITEVGCFDETFFMYGEDVDLSYRIQQAGWKNYYFSGTCIIHFKGESTKKGSLNYVRMFYQAMRLFVQKHYGSGQAKFFKIFINIAILLRAGISACSRFIKWMGLPLADILITLTSLASMAWLWETFVRTETEYRQQVMIFLLPLFTLTFILAGGIAGLYDKWYRPGRAWIAMLIAILFNLAVYSLFKEDYRFSRGVILFGGILASVVILIFRKILLQTHVIVAPDEAHEKQKTLVTGSKPAYDKVVALMQHAGRNERVLGRVGIHDNEPNTTGAFHQLSKLLQVIPAREIVFCIDEVFTMANAIGFMQAEKSTMRYKFFYTGSNSIVGSDSKETSGESLSGSETFAINSPENRRMKKTTDIFWCVYLFLLYPLNLFIVRKPIGLLRNIFLVLTGKKTWIGYCLPSEKLPFIRPCIICANGVPFASGQTINRESLTMIDYWYARDYDWLDDTARLWKAYRNLGH